MSQATLDKQKVIPAANEQEAMWYWVGLDWGKSKHSLAVVDGSRQPIATFAVKTGLDGLEDLARRLHELGEIGGIAIEATPNPVVSYLYAEGFPNLPDQSQGLQELAWRTVLHVLGLALALAGLAFYLDPPPHVIPDEGGQRGADFCGVRRVSLQLDKGGWT